MVGKPLPVQWLIPRNASKVPKAGAGAGAGCSAGVTEGWSPADARGISGAFDLLPQEQAQSAQGSLVGLGWLWSRAQHGLCSQLEQCWPAKHAPCQSVPEAEEPWCQHPACNTAGRKTTGQGQIQQGEEPELSSHGCRSPWWVCGGVCVAPSSGPHNLRGAEVVTASRRLCLAWVPSSCKIQRGGSVLL